MVGLAVGVAVRLNVEVTVGVVVEVVVVVVDRAGRVVFRIDGAPSEPALTTLREALSGLH